MISGYLLKCKRSVMEVIPNVFVRYAGFNLNDSFLSPV